MFRRRQREPEIAPFQVPSLGIASDTRGKGDEINTQPGKAEQWPVGATPPEVVAHQLSSPSTLAPAVINNQQLVLITQLIQITTTMHHVNELFLWLARALVQRLGIQVVQFWTNQEVGLSSHTLELQRMACQSELLPRYIVVNDQITQFIRYIAEQRIPSTRQSVSDIFTHQQATLLKHNGLNYCISYLLHSNTWYTSADQPLMPGQIPTPLLVVVLLFFRHPPSQRLYVSIEHILEQSLLAARNSGLLQSAVHPEQRQTSAPAPAALPLRITGPTRTLPTSTVTAHISTRNTGNLSLAELIPIRIDDIHWMRSSNPLASSVDIPDKQMRRVYVAIDGHKNLNELSLATRLPMDKLKPALQALIKEQRVRLYQPGGEMLDDTRSLGIL